MSSSRAMEVLSGVGFCVRGVIYGRAEGTDEPLRSFAPTPAGPVLLIAAAVGLLLFGLYPFCEARRRKAPEHGAAAEQPTRAPGPEARPSAP
ncbi:DUF1206 domain-containing protein [Streptomyces sp. NPDC029721]|uniref:DUF1206 domain-containing protein n=1 Tax=Streptomyces sp. NPDC029721 TaxID=3157090 RepID=UPI0033ED51A2